MYINGETIIRAMSLIGALGSLVAAILAVYKVIANNNRQNVVIKAIQDEQTLICYALKSVLQGMTQMGANGPCTEALDKLEKHLNKNAHKTEL